LFNLSRSSAGRKITNWLDQGLITKEGQGKKTAYQLSKILISKYSLGGSHA